MRTFAAGVATHPMGRGSPFDAPTYDASKSSSEQSNVAVGVLVGVRVSEGEAVTDGDVLAEGVGVGCAAACCAPARYTDKSTMALRRKECKGLHAGGETSAHRHLAPLAEGEGACDVCRRISISDRLLAGCE